jgi:hypothetical protein
MDVFYVRPFFKSSWNLQNSSYHVSKEKTSAQRQKRKKTLLGRPIFTLNLYSLVAVLRNQGRCFLSVIPSS